MWPNVAFRPIRGRQIGGRRPALDAAAGRLVAVGADRVPAARVGGKLHCGRIDWRSRWRACASQGAASSPPVEPPRRAYGLTSPARIIESIASALTSSSSTDAV
jgi:hypothetical protein